MGKKSLVNLLKYPKLFQEKAYVGGSWVSAANRDTFKVYNPSNNEAIGEAPNMNVKDVANAIDNAHNAFQDWKRKTGRERSTYLKKWYNLLIDHCDDLAAILTAEAGKPLAESRGEVLYGASFIEWYSEEAKRIEGEVPTSPALSKHMMFVREPLGVAGMITPWNFPNAMLLRKAGAALASGCTCVGRPAEDTPYSALAAALLADEAGIPKGVFNIVTSDRDGAGPIGKAFCDSEKVKGISFTGSTAVGKVLYKQCASTVKRISLELGGNAPFIVFNSANLDAAIDGYMACKFRNAGQTCVSANRLYLQSKIYDKFLERLNKATLALVVGDGFQPGVSLGPLINKRQADRVHAMVQESIKQGAKLMVGGKPHPQGQLFYEPTILLDCDLSVPCFGDEIFGPVGSVKRFETEDELIKDANDTNKGLAAYFYSQDVEQIMRVSRLLESGMVGINEGIISAAEGSFGGIKESGIGREGSKHGIDEYTHVKYICLGGLK